MSKSSDHLVGNSLSFCVKDVIEGRVDESDIQLIRCSFREPQSLDTFLERTVELYCDTYWSSNPEYARQVAERLYRSERLQFTGGHFVPTSGHWGNVPLAVSGK